MSETAGARRGGRETAASGTVCHSLAGPGRGRQISASLSARPLSSDTSRGTRFTHAM
jgi:hypothetical protein